MSQSNPVEFPKQGDDQRPRYTSYQHVGNAFSVDYPDHWVYEVLDDKLGVIFQSSSREDASILFMAMPVSVDVELLADQSPQWMGKFLEQAGATQSTPSNAFCYPSMHGMTSDGAKSWIVAHDDLIMAISAKSPDELDHIYEPLVERMLTSFRIHRDKQVARQRLLNKLLSLLREACPDSDFVIKDSKISNAHVEFSVDNLEAMIARNPDAADETIAQVVSSVVGLVRSQHELGQETWEQIRRNVYPMIRSDKIVHVLNDRADADASEKPGQLHTIVSSPWLADLVVCYAIDHAESLRMISSSDLERWSIDSTQLHQQATENLTQSKLPPLAAVSTPEGKLLFGGLAEGGLSSKSSYALHPDLYQFARAHLGGDVWVAIPARDTLMLFLKSVSDRASLQDSVTQDFKSCSHALSDRLFDLTPDGLVLA